MISRVYIETHKKKTITEVKSAFFNTPFKVIDIREDKKNPLLQIMLMSSSPGILDEDELYFEYLLHEGSALEITTQSYQRLFSMKKGALQKVTVRLKKNAFLSYLPLPTVPHKASNFKSETIIYLEKNASLLWGDILTCGRKTQNEVFKFTRFQNLTKVYLEDKLIFFENTHLVPQTFNPLHLIHFEGYTHQLSLFYLDGASNIKTLKDKLNAFLQTKTGGFGVSETPGHGVIIKVLAFKAEHLIQLMKDLTTLILNDRI